MRKRYLCQHRVDRVTDAPLGRADAGQLDRIGEVYSHLEYLWFGFEHRDQAGDEILGRKEPPALAQVQPEPSPDLSAELRELRGGPVAGAAIDKPEEPVALTQQRGRGLGINGLSNIAGPRSGH